MKLEVSSEWDERRLAANWRMRKELATCSCRAATRTWGLSDNDDGATGYKSTGSLAETIDNSVGAMIGTGGFVIPIFRLSCASKSPTVSFRSAISVSSQTTKIKASNPLRRVALGRAPFDSAP